MDKRPASFTFSKLLRLTLPVMAITLGLQLLRSFIPACAWYLKDTRGVGTISQIPYAFGTFMLGLLAPLLRRLLGERGSLWVSAGGLAILRLAEQVSQNADLDFWLTVAALGLFLNFLTLYIYRDTSREDPSFPRWVYGFVLGFSFDTALRDLFGHRDLSTISGPLPLLVIAIITILTFWSLVQEFQGGVQELRGKKGKSSALLLALGPFFSLQLLFFQSAGWLEQTAGLVYPFGSLLVMLGFLAAAAALDLFLAHPGGMPSALAAFLSIGLVYGAYIANQAGAFAILIVLLGQFFLGWCLAAISVAITRRSSSSIWSTTGYTTGGMLIFLTLSFAYFAAMDLPLPFPRASFPALAAALLGLIGLLASRKGLKEGKTPDAIGAITVGVLVLVPLACWIFGGSGPKPVQPAGYPVQVMNYNIHSGYSSAGSQDLEAIAQVIEESGADIIGMQEVSRERLMDGAADMPIWLSRRLGMEMLFQGTEEPNWGNALFSRYPILESGQGTLPRAGTLIGRGYLWARIDVGASEPLLVIVTHLHHLEQDSAVRQVQVPVILDFWNGQSSTVFIGDLNSWPGEPEIGMIAAAGLVDSWDEAGSGPGYTWPAVDPYQRIDWIWHSPYLEAASMEALQTLASDHLPVLATIQQAP
jgi:endonuclease/exonuclease/phosphatase family metal-dependent hydrolase